MGVLDAYLYDPAGNRTRVTWPETGFYVTTAYDALNRPTALQELGATTLASYAYDDLSRRSTVTLGNGTTTSYGYNPEGTLSSLGHNLAGTAQDVSYSYTRNQVREITSHGWNNDLYQWSEAANGTQNYISNGLNQYTTAAGATLGYDNKGNLSGDGVWSYIYDADNKLKSASKTGYSASLAYDPEGRLSQSTLAGTSTDLLYDGTDLVAEYDGTGTLLRRYVHGPGIDEPLVWYEGSTTADKTWLYADHQGSVVGTADGAGSSTAIYSYGPFGEPNVTTGVRFRYTGQQLLGDLNLYYYKARFYSPALGRFLQTDPIGSVDDLNLYAYVGNNPINFVDPYGLTRAEAQMLMGKIGDGLGSYVDNSIASAQSESFDEAVMRVLQGSLGSRVFSTVGSGARLIVGGSKVAKGGQELTKSAEKGIRSLEKRIAEHENKLADFKDNPTVRPGMEGQPESVIQAAQESRIRHLEKEIKTFTENIEKLRRGQ